MTPGLAMRSAITLLAVACLGYMSYLLKPGEFPFELRTLDAHTLAIEPRADHSLPADLPPGTTLDLRQQDLRTRAALYATTLPGESYVLRVMRDGELVTVPVTKVPRQETRLSQLYELTLLLVLLLGLTTLWWGRDWAAWGLCLFAIAMLMNSFLYFVPLPPVAGFGAILLNQTVIVSLLPIGLYVSALALSGPALDARLRRWFHAIFILALAVNAAVLTAATVGYIVNSDPTLEEGGVAGVLFSISICIPLAVLVVALARADAARRLRLRWILFSLILFIGPIAWNNLAQFNQALSTGGVLRQFVWWTALLCGLAGLLYAVLRKRVVAMSFAINRALVYGIVVALVIGVFGLLTTVIENTAIGADAGLALTVGVSLAIGLVLEALRDRINVLVERLFFRQRYAAETALRRFARECVYVEDADRLLAATLEEIQAHVRPDSSAFYTAGQDGYLRAAERPASGWPAHIDRDDGAFVALRADRAAVDLQQVRSALGSEGFAFPMAVRGELSGALVCGPRAEAYTRDERRLIAELAQQVATALHALRARDHEALVRALAEAEIDLPMARERARAMWAGASPG